MNLLGHTKSNVLGRLDFPVSLRWLAIGALVVGLGVLLGQSIHSAEQGELIVSVVTVLTLLLLIFRQPLDGLLLWIFFWPFLETWIKVPMGAGIPDLSFSRFIMAFLGITMLARGAIGKQRIARIGLTEVGIVASVIGITVAAPLSVSPDPVGVVQMAIALYLTPLVAYFFAKNLVTSRQDLDRLLMAIALLGFVSGAYAAYEHATGNILLLAKGTSIDNLLLQRAEGIRIIVGIWGDTGLMGRALATTIPVTFYLFLETKGNAARKMLLAVMLVVQFYGILVAMSRTPWYALLAALFVMQLFYPKFRSMFLVILLAAALLLAFTWDQVTDSAVAARVNDKVSTLEGRETLWQTGFAMWKAKPIRGWGFGWYARESGRFRTDGYPFNLEVVENDYLYILVGSGLIGFLPYLFVLLMPAINGLRLFWKARSEAWTGFVKKETIAVYWAVLACHLIVSYTAVMNSAGLKLMLFALAGAVVGSHEHLLHRSSEPPPDPVVSPQQLTVETNSAPPDQHSLLWSP